MFDKWMRVATKTITKGKKKKREIFFSRFSDFLFFLSDPARATLKAKQLLSELPPINLAVLRELFRFLTKVVANSAKNLMTAENVGVVIGPNILAKENQVNAIDNIWFSLLFLKKLIFVVFFLVFPGCSCECYHHAGCCYSHRLFGEECRCDFRGRANLDRQGEGGGGGSVDELKIMKEKHNFRSFSQSLSLILFCANRFCVPQSRSECLQHILLGPRIDKLLRKKKEEKKHLQSNREQRDIRQQSGASQIPCTQ